jgi:hypothetical protein
VRRHDDEKAVDPRPNQAAIRHRNERRCIDEHVIVATAGFRQ